MRDALDWPAGVSMIPTEREDDDREPTQPRARMPEGPRPRVLIAEDDEEFRRLLVASFEKWGFAVIEARDGRELFALVDPVRGPTVDLVVSDIRMPGVNGLDALAALREHDWQVPVVLMSAFFDPETHAEALRLGATLLHKPFPLATLERLVGHLDTRL
jgi:DNA-binding response OmpR family regulator